MCIDLRSLTAEYEVLVWWVAIREEIIFIKHLLNNNNDLDNGAKTLFNSNNIDSKGFFSSLFISVGWISKVWKFYLFVLFKFYSSTFDIFFNKDIM